MPAAVQAPAAYIHGCEQRFIICEILISMVFSEKFFDVDNSMSRMFYHI